MIIDLLRRKDTYDSYDFIHKVEATALTVQMPESEEAADARVRQTAAAEAIALAVAFVTCADL